MKKQIKSVCHLGFTNEEQLRNLAAPRKDQEW